MPIERASRAPDPARRPLSAAMIFMSVTMAVLCALPVRSFSGYSRGGAFMPTGYGARGGGMGGAVVASGGDEGAVYWNPAYLASLGREQIGFSYINLVPDAQARQSMLCYARPLRSLPEDASGQRVSSHAVGFLYSNVHYELSDALSYSENMFRFAYAYSPDKFLTVGAAVSALVSRSDVDGFDATGSSVDFGLRLQLSTRSSFGFVARNAASRLSFEDGYEETLARHYTTALSVRPTARLLLECATVFAHKSLSRATLGGEYGLYSDVVFLRGALSALTAGESRLLPHVGMGFRLRRVFLDYNANFDSSETGFADTHRFTVRVLL